MPRIIPAIVFAIASGTLAVSLAAPPATGKPITLIGNLVCAKCTLNEDTGCRHALIVEEGKEEVIYYVDDKGGREKYHRKVCDSGTMEKVKVTATLVEKKGKKHLAYPKVEFIK